MNVLALKAEPHYPFYDHGPADYRAFKAIAHVHMMLAHVHMSMCI